MTHWLLLIDPCCCLVAVSNLSFPVTSRPIHHSLVSQGNIFSQQAILVAQCGTLVWTLAAFQTKDALPGLQTPFPLLISHRLYTWHFVFWVLQHVSFTEKLVTQVQPTYLGVDPMPRADPNAWENRKWREVKVVELWEWKKSMSKWNIFWWCDLWFVIKWCRSLWCAQLSYLGRLKKSRSRHPMAQKIASGCVYDIFSVIPVGGLAYPKLQPYQPWVMMGAVRVPFKTISFSNLLISKVYELWLNCVHHRHFLIRFFVCFLSTLRSIEVIPHHRSSGRFRPHCGHHSDGTRCGSVQQQGGGWPLVYRSSRYSLVKFGCDVFSCDVLSNNYIIMFVLGLKKLRINFP